MSAATRRDAYRRATAGGWCTREGCDVPAARRADGRPRHKCQPHLDHEAAVYRAQRTGLAPPVPPRPTYDRAARLATIASLATRPR